MTKGIPHAAIYHQTLLALVPVWVLVFFHVGFYREITASAYDEFIRVLKGIILCTLLAAAVTFGYRRSEYSRMVIVLWSLFSLVFIYALRQLDKIMFKRLLYWLWGPRRVLFVGKGRIQEAVRKMAAGEHLVHALFLEAVQDEKKFTGFIQRHRISEVFLIQGTLSTRSVLEVSRFCEKVDVDCKVIPDILELRRGEIVVDGFLGLPTFHLKPLSLHGANYYLKRSFDVVVSFFILSVLFIPLVVISIFIRLDSPGPVLFTQYRMGLRGNKFKFYKFRTMSADADNRIHELLHLNERGGAGSHVFKMKNDPRITRAGRWLRKWSLDEIPQIINVIKGDMSLVGPRPQVLWEAAYYDDHAKKRLHIKPGITGLWQVSGRAALSYEEMIDLDIYYLENWSLGLDLKILLRTIPAIFTGEGAY